MNCPKCNEEMVEIIKDRYLVCMKCGEKNEN